MLPRLLQDIMCPKSNYSDFDKAYQNKLTPVQHQLSLTQATKKV